MARTDAEKQIGWSLGLPEKAGRGDSPVRLIPGHALDYCFLGRCYGSLYLHDISCCRKLLI